MCGAELADQHGAAVGLVLRDERLGAPAYEDVWTQWRSGGGLVGGEGLHAAAAGGEDAGVWEDELGREGCCFGGQV